ncbi:MAG: hypothetical protein K6F51_15170 [Acetatifactor sp.]|nr:hypothetical protein [Acetatifactor sp.]
MFFTKEDGEAYLLEVMMRQVPGFRQRRSGIRISQTDLEMDDVFGKEGKEEMKLRMERYEVPGRLRRDAQSRNGDEDLFRDDGHRLRFNGLLNGSCKERMLSSGRYLAAAFLICADEWLWEKSKGSVTDLGIFFDNMTLLVHEGFDIKQIQKWVGHADPETTLKIYSKVKSGQAKEEISAKMSSLIQLQ